MTPELSTSESRALRQARETTFPFVVTGFLLDPVVIGSAALGRVYQHRNADPQTGHFTDGHLIHTSTIAGFIEHGAFVVLITTNSVYVCVVTGGGRSALIASIASLPKPIVH